ncbi:hypothetical protein [Mixta calida]|uniref:hypothetical protein n=1 Tax=Mixta calida TaxID=665913 RepID=UPI0034D45EC2
MLIFKNYASIIHRINNKISGVSQNKDASKVSLAFLYNSMQVYPFIQPVFSLKEQTIVGVGVLLRFRERYGQIHYPVNFCECTIPASLIDEVTLKIFAIIKKDFHAIKHKFQKVFYKFQRDVASA